MGIHSSGFKDFLLKPELLRAIQDCGFEHPSEGAAACVRASPAAAVAAAGEHRAGRLSCSSVPRIPAFLHHQPASKSGLLQPASSSPHPSACPSPAPPLLCSATRVHPTGHPGHGRHLPGQVGHGQDSRVCHLHPAAAGARGWPGGAAAQLRCFTCAGLDGSNLWHPAPPRAGAARQGRDAAAAAAETRRPAGLVVSPAPLTPVPPVSYPVCPLPSCPLPPQVSVVVLCHTRELAFQICHEYERFTTYMKVRRGGA